MNRDHVISTCVFNSFTVQKRYKCSFFFFKLALYRHNSQPFFPRYTEVIVNIIYFYLHYDRERFPNRDVRGKKNVMVVILLFLCSILLFVYISKY